MGQPAGGWPGEVVSIGRKFFHVTYSGARSGRDAFRLENGRRSDGYGHWYVRTLDQVNESFRREYAQATLRRHGFELRSPSPPLAKLEAVAALLDSMGGADA
jgi:hypothetical protein